MLNVTYCFGLCSFTISLATFAIASSHPVMISWSSFSWGLQLLLQKTKCVDKRKRRTILEENNNSNILYILNNKSLNMYYLDLQVASKERMACRRLFLELFAMCSASWCGNSMPSCFAMNSKTSTIWRKEENSQQLKDRGMC